MFGKFVLIVFLWWQKCAPPQKKFVPVLKQTQLHNISDSAIKLALFTYLASKQATSKLLLPKNIFHTTHHIFFASFKSMASLLAWQHFHCILHKSWWCRCQLGSFHGHFSGLFTSLCVWISRQAFENLLKICVYTGCNTKNTLTIHIS